MLNKYYCCKLGIIIALYISTSLAWADSIQIAKGQQLFESICAHCHHITYEESTVGAPGLKGVLERHDEAWLNQWIKSPKSFAKQNETAQDLINNNPFGLVMPSFPDMQNSKKRTAVIEYLKTLR